MGKMILMTVGREEIMLTPFSEKMGLNIGDGIKDNRVGRKLYQKTAVMQINNFHKNLLDI